MIDPPLCFFITSATLLEILYTAERCTEIALQAIQILGGNVYINDYPVARLLRDSKLYGSPSPSLL